MIATLNSNTNKIEVDLVEEVYQDQENTDKLTKLTSAVEAPFVVSVAVCRDKGNGEGDVVVMDCDGIEIQCVD